MNLELNEMQAASLKCREGKSTLCLISYPLFGQVIFNTAHNNHVATISSCVLSIIIVTITKAYRSL